MEVQYPYSILVVDDEPDNLDAFRFNFRKQFNLLTAESGAAALELLAQHEVAVVVTDQRMPKMTGIELLREARAKYPHLIGIILTAFTDLDVLIDAINLGHVYRYITKPWDAKELRGVLQYALQHYHLARENRRLQEQLTQYTGYLNAELHGKFDYGNIIGDSPALREVLTAVEQVAPTNSTVLLRGETGTGKELVAHAIHINSTREAKPFVRVNCAALAPGVLESELFGHEKGAFTGALARRLGRFEVADGGTLFLDEVGDLPMDVQIKLLRVLQERAFERVGGSEPVRVDVRLVSATNRNLEEMIAAGDFRQDLYYRLNVFPVHLPPLRARGQDIVALAKHFITKFARRDQPPIALTTEAQARLLEYPWPGNVRELENIMERAVILSRGKDIEAAHLTFGPRSGAGATGAPEAAATRLSGEVRPGTAAEAGTAGSPGMGSVGASLAHGWTHSGDAPDGGHGTMPGGTSASGHVETWHGGAGDDRSLSERLLESERREITQSIERAKGNIAAAARTLGINRSTLYYRLRKLGLEHLLPTKVSVGSDGADGSDGDESHAGAGAAVEARENSPLQVGAPGPATEA